MQCAYLNVGVLEQVPAVVEAKDALADGCGVEAIAAQDGGICVALNGRVLEQVPAMALHSRQKSSNCRNLFRIHRLSQTDSSVLSDRPVLISSTCPGLQKMSSDSMQGPIKTVGQLDVGWKGQRCVLLRLCRRRTAAPGGRRGRLHASC